MEPLGESTARLSPIELVRYDRQLPLLGVEGQARLKNTSVAVIGAGGLGSFEALYLAGLGVGRIVIVDGDTVEESNLNRQVLHWEEDIGRPKALSAAEKLQKFNPYIRVEAVQDRLRDDNAEKIIGSVDAVLDALDNWETRLLVDRVAYRLGKTFVHAGVHGLEGQVVPIVPGETSCLKCLLPPRLVSPQKPPAVAPIVAIIAAIAVVELVKILTGIGESNKGKMIVFDGSTMELIRVNLRPRPDCKCLE